MNNKKTVGSRDLKQGLGYRPNYGNAKSDANKKMRKLKKEDLTNPKAE